MIALDEADADRVRALLNEHARETGSRTAERLLAGFDPARYAKVVTCREPEPF